MNQKARMLPSLIVSVLCTHCVTSRTALTISDSPPITIECFYTEPNRLDGKSEIECSLENQGHIPGRIRFSKAGFEDQEAEIVPIDISRLKQSEALDTIIVVIGVIVIIGVVVALAASCRSSCSHIQIPTFSSSSTPPTQKLALTASDQKDFFGDIIELQGKGSALLVFAARHGIQRPKVLHLELDNATVPLRVPIKNRL